MEAKKFKLEDLIKKIECGEIQLPDFQREWIWSDEQIKSLLESVIRGFPINSIMLLECNSNDIKFSFRPIEGAEKTSVKPQYLILDGQQRLTSLYCSLFCDKPVKISNDKKDYFYYIDMKRAIEYVKNSMTVENMIISVPSSRKLKSGNKITLDLSTPDKEFAANMFPLNRIFKETRQWLRAYEKFHDNARAEQSADDFDEKIISKISSYEIVDIELEKDTSLEAVCKIFEKVNIGGSKLEIFDLLTAIFAANKTASGKSIALREDLDKIKTRFEELDLKILKTIEYTDFVTALTLLVSYEKSLNDKKIVVSCKGEDILSLNYRDYLDYKEDLVGGFIEAGKFLEEEGITTKKYLPYKPQLIPLAAIFTELNLMNKDNAANRKKISQWYWCGVFGESYRDGAGTRCAKDFVQVMNWINRNRTPETIENLQIGAWDLMKVKSIQSAVGKGIISIIFKNGAKDFLNGKNMGSSADYAESIEIHHIFPKKYCESQKISKEKYDGIANKTLILKNTNKIIGGNPPSIYLEKIGQKSGLSSTELNEILEKHFIDAEICRADDFQSFIVDRAKKILDSVENLIGRQVSGRNSLEIRKIFGESL